MLVIFFPEAEKAFQESLSLRESWERDLAWTIRLSHHYLSKLAVNDSYIIDNRYPVKQNRCDCCHKNIEGQYGDTSIGMLLWCIFHGQVLFCRPTISALKHVAALDILHSVKKPLSIYCIKTPPGLQSF